MLEFQEALFHSLWNIIRNTMYLRLFKYAFLQDILINSSGDYSTKYSTTYFECHCVFQFFQHDQHCSPLLKELNFRKWVCSSLELFVMRRGFCGFTLLNFKIVKYVVLSIIVTSLYLFLTVTSQMHGVWSQLP